MNAEPNKRDWIAVSTTRTLLQPLNRTLPNYIFHVVCEQYGVPREILLGKSRLRVYSRPRQMAMYLLRHLTRKSYPDIGRVMGKDHTTVLHGVRAVDRRASKDNAAAAVIVDLERKALDLYSRD